MWINRFVSRLMGRLELWLTARLAPENLRESALAQAEVHTLNEKLFAQFDHRAAQQFSLESDYSDVLELTAILRAATYALEHGEKFNTELLPTQPRIMSLDEFFIDKQHCYINARLAVANFKKESLAFLMRYHAIADPGYGIPNFNQRVLSKLKRSALATARALKEFSR